MKSVLEDEAQLEAFRGRHVVNRDQPSPDQVSRLAPSYPAEPGASDD